MIRSNRSPYAFMPEEEQRQRFADAGHIKSGAWLILLRTWHVWVTQKPLPGINQPDPAAG